MKTNKILLTIFIITLLTRLILSFITPNFTYDSYFHLRHVDHITNNLTPLYEDPLSYGGRELTFLPIFHYLAALFNLFLPLTIVAKLLPNLLLSTLIITTYLIAKKITNSKIGSLLAAGIAGFLPILFTTNSFTPETLFLPLIFLSIYFFLNKQTTLYLITFTITCFTSSSTFILIIGFIIYLLLSFIEKKNIEVEETELILFSAFFYIWSQFLFFNNTLLREGANFIWQNIPKEIITTYFPTISILEALVFVSFIPLLTGAHTIFNSLINPKNKYPFLLISFAISTIFFTAIKFIPFKLALAFFGIILAILFASFYQDLLNYFKKTKAHKLKNFLLTIIIILLILTTVYPAITIALEQETPTDDEIKSFRWIATHTPEHSRILASVQEGHLVTFFSHRKNLMDDHFSLIGNVEQRYNELTALYQTPFQTQALSILNKHNIKYLVLTPQAKHVYNITQLQYLTSQCFREVHSNGVKIYENQCELAKT